ASCPAIRLAIPIADSHTPISKEAILSGATLLTNDKPTGDKHNSPNVCNKYVNIIKAIWAFVTIFCSSLPVYKTAGIRIINPTPSNIMPKPIFVIGFRSPVLDLESLSHKIEIIGAKLTMNNGFSDWNQETGTRYPNTSRSTKFLVYNVNELPACSNPAQKKTTKHARIIIANVLFFSFFVSGCFWFFFSGTSFTFNWVGCNPTLPKYLLLKLLNRTCPIIIPMEEARKAHLKPKCSTPSAPTV